MMNNEGLNDDLAMYRNGTGVYLRAPINWQNTYYVIIRREELSTLIPSIFPSQLQSRGIGSCHKTRIPMVPVLASEEPGGVLSYLGTLRHSNSPRKTYIPIRPPNLPNQPLAQLDDHPCSGTSGNLNSSFASHRSTQR